MKNKDKLINKIIDGFQYYKGKASTYCFSTNVIPELIYNIISLFTKKHKDASIFIVVDSYNTRKNIDNYLKTYNITTYIDIYNKEIQ